MVDGVILGITVQNCNVGMLLTCPSIEFAHPMDFCHRYQPDESEGKQRHYIVFKLQLSVHAY